MESDYPMVLGFTCPRTKQKIEKVMPEQSDAEGVFNWFYAGWGRNVPYSLNKVDFCFCTSCAGITRSPDIMICEDCAKEATGEVVEPK
jgi:hypothetical protein